MQTLRQKKKVVSRQRMLDTAKRLFIENGYSRTTMEEIAEQAGFGVATLYNYFKTKEGMFAAMAHDDMSELRALEKQHWKVCQTILPRACWRCSKPT